MTAQLEVPVMSDAMRRFEEIDAAFPDVKAEMIDGSISIDTAVTSAHGNLVITIASQLMSKWFVMTEVDTVCAGWHGATLLKPDVSVAPASYRRTNVAKFPADELLLAVEVVSEPNPENDTSKKVTKYAQAGIPYYLVVNPVDGTCLLHSAPAQGDYRKTAKTAFGDPVRLGDPIGITLDTTGLYTY